MLEKIKNAWLVVSVFLFLTLAVMLMLGTLRLGESGGHAGHGEAHEEHGEEHGESEGAGAVDLDHLEEEQCEHGVRTVDCNACRFELGVVKVKPGIRDALLKTEQLKTVLAEERLDLVGQAATDLTRTVEVSSSGGGVVQQLHAFLGDKVSAGDKLAVIRSSELGEAKAAYIEAQARFEAAERALAREQALRDKNISSEADYIDALSEFKSVRGHMVASEMRLHVFGLNDRDIKAIPAGRHNGAFADMVIKAPRAGTIVSHSISEGKLVETGQQLMRISDLSELWIWADVYTTDLAVLHAALSRAKRLPATVSVDEFRDQTFRGTVDLLDSTVDEHTRTAKVRIRVPNESGLLRPGMFVRAEIRVPTGRQMPAVPSSAVMHDEGRAFVFQFWKDDLWVRRDITVGRAQGDMVEVAKGPAVGTTLVVEGAFMLKSDVLRAKMGAGCAD